MVDALYGTLAAFDERPVPFSVMTIGALWTDSHIASQMLAFHLDATNDLASRRPETIDAFVDWLDARFVLAQRTVTDLGCGPGLYCQRLAARGAHVTGIDFSPRSVDHARRSAADAGLAIDYRVANYLTDPLPESQDLVVLIYGDYCAMAPGQRALLLTRIHRMLKADGVLVFDVFSPGQMAGLVEGVEAGRRLMGDFWAEDDYFALKRTFVWPAARISLERYLVLQPDRRLEIYNWMQYYTPASIAAELAQSGYVFEASLEVATGLPWQESPTAFVVLARPQ